MSIFNFLEEIFFCRTEKSRNQMCLKLRTEISKKMKPIIITFFIKIEKQ